MKNRQIILALGMVVCSGLAGCETFGDGGGELAAEGSGVPHRLGSQESSIAHDRVGEPSIRQLDEIGWKRRKVAKPRMLFSCTTFLSRPGKAEQLRKALASFYEHLDEEERALFSRFIVVNEYGGHTDTALVDEIRAEFSWVEVIDKGPELAGQAASLNVILDQLDGIDLWVHWEESWVCRRPFIAEALRVMESSNITQLQVSSDIWGDMGMVGPVQQTAAGDLFAEVMPTEGFLRIQPSLRAETYHQSEQIYGLASVWPLYSLRPSVNRAPFYAQLGYFDTRPEMWPWIFEWDFGMRWFQAGAVKGVLSEEAAERSSGHVSTYCN